MKFKLKQVASIQTGIFAKPITDGEIVYLQAKHFDLNGQLKTSLHPDLQRDNINERHFLRHGDVLFATKGTKNFAAWYMRNNAPAVASTSFFVIRMKEDVSSKVSPEFLVWYLNHPGTQKLLKGKAIGTAIASISKIVLEELEISITDIETQKAILYIVSLRNEEKKLKQQIETLREKQIQQQIINAI